MNGQYVDHYDILGIPPSATADEIKAAHRRRILAAHPDVAGRQGSAEAAVRINVARDVLLDPRARRRFDDERARRRAQARRASRPAPKHAAPRPSRPASYSASAPPSDAGRHQQTAEPPRGKQASADAGPETSHPTGSRGRVFTWASVLRWCLATVAVLLALVIIVIGLGAKGLGTFMIWADRLRSSTPSSFELGHVRVGSALIGFGWYVLRIAIALFLGVGFVQAVLNWRGQGAATTPGPGHA